MPGRQAGCLLGRGCWAACSPAVPRLRRRWAVPLPTEVVGACASALTSAATLLAADCCEVVSVGLTVRAIARRCRAFSAATLAWLLHGRGHAPPGWYRGNEGRCCRIAHIPGRLVNTPTNSAAISGLISTPLPEACQ
jgi:hypothetical protein